MERRRRRCTVPLLLLMMMMMMFALVHDEPLEEKKREARGRCHPGSLEWRRPRLTLVLFLWNSY